jgi:N6-L-threonylcarbamoyladenine synthase
LIGALLVGVSFAKSLAYSQNKPLIAINHMIGHIFGNKIEHPDLNPPYVALVVSGGHTELVDFKSFDDFTIIGKTKDDAAGEAFDKVAKILGLTYPGGPEIEKLAKKGDPKRFKFPRPMVNRKGLDFSFSGLKTFSLNCFGKNEDDDQTRADIAYAFQDAVVDTFVIKCKRAIKQTGLTKLIVAGGVSANKMLRQKLDQMGKAEGVKVYYPRLEFCTDNGAMIAYAGWRHFVSGDKTNMEIKVSPRVSW